MSLAKLIVGPPGSGKTTMLMFYGKKESDVGPHCQYTLCIGSIKDIRGDPNSVISTHNDSLNISNETKNIDFIKVDKLMTIVNSIPLYDVILIDEGHFFVDLIQFVDDCIWKYHKIVMVAGIVSDVKCQVLGDQMCGLFARATEPYSIVTLAGRCGQCLAEGKRGNNALGNYVKIIGVDSRINQIQVGGLAMYQACCARHHPRYNESNTCIRKDEVVL